MNKLIFLLVFSALLSACSSLSVTTPTPIIETPEISGSDSFKFGASATLTSGNKYEATGDASFRPPTLTSPAASHVLSTLGGVHADFLQRFRLGLGGDPFNGGLFGQAQIQVFGDGRTTAKKGNFSMSVFGHAGNNNPDKNGDQSGAFGPGGNPWSAEIKSDWYDYGTSIGYRVSDATNLFVGVAKQLLLYRIKIDQTQGVAPNGIYQASDRGEANKIMGGFSWGGEKGEVSLGADYTDLRFNHAPKLHIASISLGVALDFK